MKKTVISAIFAVLALPLVLFGVKTENGRFACEEVSSAAYLQKSSDKAEFEYIKYGKVPHAGPGSAAMEISDWFYSELRMDVEVVSANKNTPTDALVVYGLIDSIPLSISLAAEIDLLGSEVYAWGMAYENGTLALYANSKIAFSDPESVFPSLLESLSEFISDGEFRIQNGFVRIESVSYDDYTGLVEEKKEMQKQEQIENFKNGIETEFPDSIFDPDGLGITTDMTVESGKSYSSPLYYPEVGEHPRVLFTADMIPGIRAALEDPVYSAARAEFEALLKNETDGKLGKVVTTATYSNNFSSDILNVIQAKAFAYAVYGDEYYGYCAIYSILNFMKTLDYNFKQIDQTRDFGAIIYTAACVYDWCYDLLSDSAKRSILLGVEHVACRGYVDEPEKASFDGVKLEMGFPPVKQGAVTGHGCEMMLLRNFLSISIAVFDEYPGWYEFCAGRFFEEYIEPRNLYYSAGMYPQGTQYNTQRFHCDLYSAALIKVISGKIPYNESDMRDTVYGLFATVSDVGNRGTFFVGDIRRTNTQVLARTGECAMIASYLFDDPILRGIAQWRENGFSKFSSGAETLTPTEFFAFASNGVGISENGILDVPSVIYNGGWYGQMSVRESWRDDSAVVLMKVQERTTANHDHAAAGTFQIYYKGMLTGDMGDYAGDVYGSDHCKYFLRSTVAHNGLLIYDPAKQDTLSGYYVGGQRSGISEASSLSGWLESSSYDTGKVTGYSYGYRLSGDTEFAYIAGDITQAYDKDQASYVGRSMLTVYTGDESAPMIFFVFDRIDSQGADFVKKFLLQVPTSQAPVIDENAKTVEINNGEGKLLLTNILGADEIVALGGTDSNGNRLNYQINGKQVDFITQGVVTNRDSWGRVELVQSAGSTLGNFFNVICVGDASERFESSPISFAAYDKATRTERILEGAAVGSYAALFVNSDSRTSEETVFTVPGDGISTVYVAGLYTGTWRLYIGGEYVGTVYSTNDSGMVKINVPAGVEITLAPTEEVRPSNAGEIIYVTDGGSFLKVPSRYYPLGEATPLPTNISRGSDIFDGWYEDAELTKRIYEIPADAPGKMTVYAKWVEISYCEDYTNTTINTTEGANTADARYSCDNKPNTSFVTDNYRGLLTWIAGEAGSHITVNASTLKSSSGLISSISETGITYSFTFALNGTNAPQDIMIRVRDNGFSGAQKAITIAYVENGVFKLGNKGAPIFTLSSKMQTANITVDFASCKLIAKDEAGEVIAETSFSLPDVEGIDGIGWMKYFDSELLNVRAQSKGSILVGRLAVMEGDTMLIPPEPITDSVIYVTNGGSFDFLPDTSYTPGTEKLLADDISREGYVFLGWYASSDFSGNPITALPKDASGEFPVYAKWASHNVVYETNGGSFDTAPDTAYTPGTEKPLELGVSKDGYIFQGWYTSPDFSGEPITSVPESAFDLFTVYAKWILAGNVVVYDPAGGTLVGVPMIESGELAEYYSSGEIFLLKTTVTKTGCEFLGWFTDDGTRIESLGSDSVGAVYLTARWTVKFLSEDYSETVIDSDGRAGANGFTYSFDNKAGTSFVTDEEGEYLLFTATAGGPHITANSSANNYAGMDSSLLSLRISLAKNGDEDAMNFRIRVRDKGGCSAGLQCDLVLLYCKNGTVYLGHENKSVKLFDLADEFTDVRIVLDFEDLKLYAYASDGSIIAEVDVYVPESHEGINGAEWQGMFKDELLNFRASSAGSIKISEISVCEGNIFKK